MDTVATADRVAAFETLYRRSADPWQVRARWYEQRKIGVLVSSLPRRHYPRIYEPAAGTGELSAALRARCASLHVSEASVSAVGLLRERFASDGHVAIRQERLPQELPRERNPFDLIVLSEFCYYLEPDAVARLARRCRDLLGDDGHLLACHWTGASADRTLDTRTLHRLIGRQFAGSLLVRHEEPLFHLNLWCRRTEAVLPPA